MIQITEETLKAMHKHSFKNKEEVLNSAKCACFNCFRIYDPKEIDTVLTEDDGKGTVLCPYCLVDMVIGGASGFELTDELIDAVADYYILSHTRGDMKGFEGYRVIEHITMTHDDLQATNTQKHPYQVVPQKKGNARVEKGKLSVKLAKLSWNVIRLGKRGE